ncbi:MAG: diguanylate cyclase domain-containing protein [Niveispirillum sp.]|uniref:GGDEF domain-containing protein n=1 Tax=Niveispirillum sp. TaxID=1917217 RepID=UPI003BA5B41D
MSGLDIFTISTVVAALAVINTVALIMVWRINPTVPGLGTWSLSQCLHISAWLLSVAVIQGSLQGPIYTLVNNSLNLASMILLFEGAMRFRGFGHQATRRWLILAGIAMAVGISILNKEAIIRRYIWHDSICMVMLIAAAVTMMWRTAPHERIVHGMAAGFFAAMAGAAAWRWSVAVMLPEGEAFPYRTLNVSVFTLVALCGLGWVYGVMLSVNMRVRQQVLAVSQIDPLTGLANRRQLESAMMRALARQRRGAGAFGIAYFDLDRFKSINDRYGHTGGDAVLVTVAERLCDFLRDSDNVARIGGDEFVVLFSKLATGNDLDRACARLRQAVEGPMVLGDDVEDVRISLGAALAPRDGQNIDTLLNHADQAMYEDKRRRRAERQPEDGAHIIPFPPPDEKGRPRGAAFN